MFDSTTATQAHTPPLVGAQHAAPPPAPCAAPPAAASLTSHWTRAFDLWLATKAPNTRRAYQRAWHDLLTFSAKPPWRLHTADLQAWADDLAWRHLHPTILKGLQHTGRRHPADGHGLAPSTIAQWLSAASSFFHFVTTRYLVPTSNGRERPLHDTNPALAVHRPDVTAYARAHFLDAPDLTRLLGAIPLSTLQGRRDYALFLGYILTGRRNTEWRTLRWADLRARGANIYYHWQGKNTTDALHQLPPPLWDAIRAYLDTAPDPAAQPRLLTIQPADYLFTPLTDRATRLPNIDPAAWDPNRPLSAATVNRLLKHYARRAGLDPRPLHVHTLRHSAAMLEEQTGAGLLAISRLLGHADPKTTIRYLDHLRGQPDTSWAQKCALLDLPGGQP